MLEGSRLVVIGGTGFLGKVFWSMLLDRYPEVGKIFLVVRRKGAPTPQARFEADIAPSEVLDPLRKAHGERFDAFLREKVVPIDGDMGSPRCGIEPALVEELRGTIDAVVNVAGVVDFNPPLDDALDANAFGAQNLIDLARALGDTPVFHTSTCFVAGSRKGPILEEDPRVRPFPRSEELGASLWDPDREIAECLDLIAQAKHRCEDAFRQSELRETARKNLEARGEPASGPAFDDELARVKRKFIVQRLVEAGLDRATHWGWQNIYTYTKAIGEQVIARSGLPFTITRPASCETTVAFPSRGYLEGINTTAPFAYMIMKGQQQIVGGQVPLDLIPVDYVVAGMIMALAELLEGTAKPVYQLGGSDVNPYTVQRFGELMGMYKRRHYQRKGGGNPLLNALQARFEPSFVDMKTFEQTGSPAMAAAAAGVASVVKEAIPALRPAARALEGFAKQQSRIAALQRTFEPFTTKINGPFDCANTRAAFARLSPADKEKLPWAPESIDWPDWMLNVHLPALEKRVLPEMDRRFRREVKALTPHATLVSLLGEMAERHGASLALQLLTDDGLTRVTYRDLLGGAEAVAARLASIGIQKGDRVALSGRNHPDWAVAYFGILRAGATAVPLDPGLDAASWGNVLAESRAKAVLWDETVRARSEIGARVPSLARLDLHEVANAATTLPLPDGTSPALAGRGRYEDVVVGPGDVASLIYTSGTTGRPKGVMLTHANFTSLVAALAPIFPLSRGDAVLSVLPLHHTFEFTCGLLLPLTRGARVVYVGELTGDRLTEGLRLSRARAMVGVPALWQLIERKILQGVDEQGPFARAAFDAATEANRWLAANVGVDVGRVLFGPVHAKMGGHVKWLISGGAALPKQTQELFAGLGLALTEGYGLTEAAPVLTVSRPGKRLEPGVGKPVPGVEIRIDRPDERGVGEVVARGPNVMVGYTDPEATAKTIDAEGWLHTGDLGRVDRKGRLEIVGRLKDVVISPTGENVYPDDVERRLGEVPHVAELAVAGIEVGGAERLGCLAVPSNDGTSEALPRRGLHQDGTSEAPPRRGPHQGDGTSGTGRTERNLRARAALRKAIDDLPFGQRPVVVHLYDAPLPRTASRKVKRDEVRAILRRMVAASARAELNGVGTSSVRSAIAALKGLPADSISSHATLQGDLGFDSLMMTELLEALEAGHGEVDVQRLQRCVTVGDVEELTHAATSSVEGSHAAGPSRQPAREDVPLVLPEPIREVGKAFVGKLQDLFYGEVMRPRVYGRAYIPYNRSTIVVANHASHLDMGLVRHALGSYGEGIVSLAAQDYFFESGIKRAFFENLTNLRAIDRKASLRQAIRQASEVIEQGRTVLIFPEGTRSASGELQEFKPLLGHLALVHGKDILPVFLGGTHAAMPKGTPVPIKRDLLARIGPPLAVEDLRRLTQGMPPADAAREVARIAQRAVAALAEGKVLDLSQASAQAQPEPEPVHPLVKLFGELEGKFKAGEVDKAVSYYVTLGNDELAKWTVRVDGKGCEVRPGKPEGGQADCVLKTSPEIFTKIVRESYVPSPADFLSGAVKSNDVTLLLTFQRVFRLDQAR
jgi:long-chain acyl-CoA synthetase